MYSYDWSHAAEAHDIGRLFIKEAKHNLEDMLDGLKRHGVNENWPVVQVMLKHHCKPSPEPRDIQLYPDSYETLLAHLADTLASQASWILRKLEEGLKVFGANYCVYKLWRTTDTIHSHLPGWY